MYAHTHTQVIIKLKLNQEDRPHYDGKPRDKKVQKPDTEIMPCHVSIIIYKDTHSSKKLSYN